MFRIKEIICNLTQNMSFVEIKCLGVEMNSTSSCFFFFFLEVILHVVWKNKLRARNNKNKLKIKSIHSKLKLKLFNKYLNIKKNLT
jgi:hypothetical protein